MAQEDRRRVLDMLAEGKISADEAERLLEILDASHHRDGSGENAGRQNSQDPNIDDKIERAVITTVRSAVETARSIVSEIPGSLERPDGYEEAKLSGERREDTFRVEDVPTLEVENFNGRVEIVGDSEDDNVRVTAIIRHPDLVDYSAVQEGNRVAVRTTPGGKRSFLGWRFLNRGAHIRISTPREAKVDVHNSNGRATVRRIEGGGILRTSNGRIELEDLTGEFRMTTSNSRIEAARVEGEYKLESSNGRIRVRDGKGTFDVETSNGNIRFAGEILPKGESRLATSNGSISATLKGKPSLQLNASTSNGSIACEREVEIRGDWKKRQLRGVIGDGKGILTLKSSNGSITIE